MYVRCEEERVDVQGGAQRLHDADGRILDNEHAAAWLRLRVETLFENQLEVFRIDGLVGRRPLGDEVNGVQSGAGLVVLLSRRGSEEFDQIS